LADTINIEDLINRLGDEQNLFTTESSLLQDIIQKWSNKAIDLMRKELDAKNANASSALKQSIQFGEITQTPTSLFLTILMEDYWEYVEFGRKPTKKGHQGGQYLWQSIKEWMSYKGIKPAKGQTYDSLAQAIARKIHRVGYKGKHFIEDSFTESIQQELANELATKLGDIIFSVEIKK
jgi:hypothetical protein